MCGTARTLLSSYIVWVSGVGADERPRAGGLACAEVEPANVVEFERELVLKVGHRAGRERLAKPS